MSHYSKLFFKNSELLDYLVLKPLSHITPNWELTWSEESDRYAPEDDSMADLLNRLVDDIASCNPPVRYHDNEDRLAEHMKGKLGWNIKKVGDRWVGAGYFAILEQGGFKDIDQRDLLEAAAGRVKAAVDRGQKHFDEMEESHRLILGTVLSIILYHRAPYA